ncbi:hypothetical protein [Flavobacterium sp.]|uniref:hypothetical protein n=1 Tax=Flavobacterium sp. TaxID=239 RepID=UPI00286DB442|nr:hypothetical protein [Flavobacterium sp.]
MKTQILILFAFCISNAQNNQGIIGDSNWFNNWTNFRPKAVEYKESTKIINGEINVNTTLYRNNVYLLVGTVYVCKNAVLTIEPGTVIRGDFETNSMLMVVKGSKIIAEGTETNPIVFTSNRSTSERKPGDWGGIVLLGEAPINMHGGMASCFYDQNPLFNGFGGKNENSDSGILKYVRIEFAGKKIDSKIALNGLTLAGVGNQTKLEYIQVSFASDDSFEVIGGNNNLSNVISYRAFDDDFDYSFGTQAIVNNSIAIRNPFNSDNTRSRCFEIDSYDKIENVDVTKKKTLLKLKNITLLNSEESASLGLIKEAISLKYDSFLEMENCIVSGFSSFIALDNKYQENNNFKNIKVYNSTINNCAVAFTNETLQKNDQVNDWFLNNANLLKVSNVEMINLFKNPDLKKKPDFRIK